MEIGGGKQIEDEIIVSNTKKGGRKFLGGTTS